jgi:uncharacterized protein (DUF433 family)/predicted nuclease of predicted toxin-antitoxin system
MTLIERITIDPEICHGKPTIRGLRYTVELILELLSSGMTIEEILADYEDLEREDILAALKFATRLSRIKRIEPALVWTSWLMLIFRGVWLPCYDRRDTMPFTRSISLSAIAQLMINELSINEQRVVVTKDSDFVDSLVLRGQPWKLLLVSTGNIHNNELIPLFLANIDRIAEAFETFDFIEINRTNVIFHS